MNTEKNINKKVKLSGILSQSNIFLLQNINHKRQLFTEISKIIESSVNFSNKEILKKILDKEELENSSIGGGVALPNIKFTDINESVGIFLKLNKSINYNAIDNEPVDLIFTLISPKIDSPIYLNELAYISRLLTQKKTLQNIRGSLDIETIYAILTNEI
jgi:PTS system nitrogen regulatory IIA component